MDLLWLQIKDIWPFALFFGFNVFAFLSIKSWMRYLSLAASIPMGLGLLIFGAAMVDSYFSGCYSAPKQTEFHQGMTLCPGQSAVFTITTR
jgi:hypothetical protein